MYCSNDTVPHIREASRSLTRELGLLSASLGEKDLPASAVRALIEIGDSTSTTSSSLNKTLNVESSNFGWILAKLVDTGAVIEISSAEDTRHKILSITDKGKRILSKIDSLADERVMNALEKLPETSSREQVLHGIRSYAAALRAQRLEEEEDKPVEKLVISSGYRPGLLGQCLEMHMQYYPREAGFGASFESQLATGLGDLLNRLDSPKNEVWHITDGANIYGTVFIDGDGLGENKAHLRAFIVDNSLRGQGLGRKLIEKAMAFVDNQGFVETHLYTFNGLDGR